MNQLAIVTPKPPPKQTMIQRDPPPAPASRSMPVLRDTPRPLYTPAGYALALRHRKAGQMSTFDDRERAEEAKYAHDSALQFKITNRRNKLLGLWAADLMNLSGSDAEAYAKTVVRADLEEPGDEDVFRKIRADFDAKGVDRSDARIREHMAELIAVAREQVMKEVKDQ
jgi:hypothetical protein